jgi:hypothetical protein
MGLSRETDPLQYFLYSWVTNMWGYMQPVPRVSDPTVEGSTAEDLDALVGV